MKKPVIKLVKTDNGIVEYHLMNEQLVKRKGVLYKNSYWLEGSGYDTNNDGQIANMTMECKVPEGHSDIDLSTLREECLFKDGDKLIYNED